MKYPKLQNKQEWFQEFQKTEKYREIILFVNNYSNSYYHQSIADNPVKIQLDDKTVDEKAVEFYTPRNYNISRKILNIDSFRILEYINKHGSKPIYDIGCGMNFFSNFYDVVGMEPTDPSLSIQTIPYIYSEKFNSLFADKHENAFPSAIAINSIHFIPIFDVGKRILDFSRVIKPGGLGYATFNVEVLYKHTDDEFLKLNNLFDATSLKNYLNSLIFSTNLNIIDYEEKITEQPPLVKYDRIDGTIRVLFAKNGC